MRKGDVFRKYADLIDMCEGVCIPAVKCNGIKGFIDMESIFDKGGTKSIEFPLFILENKLVFKGDVLWNKADSGWRHIVLDVYANPEAPMSALRNYLECLANDFTFIDPSQKIEPSHNPQHLQKIDREVDDKPSIYQPLYLQRSYHGMMCAIEELKKKYPVEKQKTDE